MDPRLCQKTLINVVAALVIELPDELVEVQPRLLFDELKDRVGALLVNRRGLMRQVVLQETQIALEYPVNFGGRTQPVVQAEWLGHALAGWAPPMARLVAQVAVRHGLGEPFQPGFGFPFLPTGRVAL